MNNFIAQYGLNYTFVLDPTGEIGKMYRITSTPTTYFVDHNGVIRDIQIGVVTQSWLESSIGNFPILEG